MSKEILDAIKRLCEIVINNPSIDSELDSLALHISHHPDVINPTSHNKGYSAALQEIIDTGLCNLPDVRCDKDMFDIAWKCLNPDKPGCV